MADQKIIFSFYRKFCLLTMIFLISFFLLQPASAQTTITVIPSDSNVMIGENFDIDVSVETDQTFVGAQMIIDFDSSLVSTTELYEGNLFSNSGLFYMFNTGTIDNSQGSIDDIFAVTLGGGGISNDGNFIHINMTAGNTSGICNVHLENVIFSNSEGIPIPVILRNADIEIIASSAEQIENIEASSSSGGGGGGAGNTGENAENIELVETKNIYVMSSSPTSYVFEEEANPITSIKYLSLKNAGTITGTIEVLNGKSAIVAEDPSGIVYKNMNIWIGKSGYATETNIDSPVVAFKVSSQWMNENSASENSITLMRYNLDKWNSLTTKKVGEDEKYTFFESETPGFSPFCIVASIDNENYPSEDESETPVLEEHVKNEQSDYVEKETDNINVNKEANKTLDQNTVLLLCLSLLLRVAGKNQE